LSRYADSGTRFRPDVLCRARRERLIPLAGGLLGDDEYDVVADAADTVAVQVIHDPIEQRAKVRRADMVSQARLQVEKVAIRVSSLEGTVAKEQQARPGVDVKRHGACLGSKAQR
jgi:hypothetical protein